MIWKKLSTADQVTLNMPMILNFSTIMMLRKWSHPFMPSNFPWTNIEIFSKSWVISSDGANQIFAVSNAISPDHIADSNSWNIKLEKDGYEKFVPVWKANSDPWNLTIEFNFECVEGDGFPIGETR